MLVSAAQQPVPSFRSGVDVIRLDVSVLDKVLPLAALAPGAYLLTLEAAPAAVTGRTDVRFSVR